MTEDYSRYNDIKTVVIRTTEVGSCHRKRQHNIRGVYDSYGSPVKPMLAHWYPVRGWVSHYHAEEFIKNNGDYVPEPLIPPHLTQQYQISTDMMEQLRETAKHDYTNFLAWTKTTDVDLTPKNITGLEYQILMPISPPKNSPVTYVQQSDIDLLTASDIVDFKSGKKSYITKYKWQLGSYRRAARYARLHEHSPTGDFRLINVFLGGDKPQEQIHDMKKIKEKMLFFDTELQELMEQDILIRTDPKYQAPCSVGIYCVFCKWRHCCRGI